MTPLLSEVGWLGIDAASHALPGDPIDIEDWGRSQHYDADMVARTIASGCRYFHAAQGEEEVALAIRAADRLVEQTGLAPGDFDALVHVHSQPFSTARTPRSLPLEVASALGIRPAWCGSVGQLSCASINAGLRAVESLMRADAGIQNALLVSVDRVYAEDHRLRHGSGIQSDGAACLLLGRNSRANRIGTVALWNHFARWYSGTDSSDTVEREAMAMNWVNTRDIIEAACADCGVSALDFARVLPLNSDLKGWRSLCRSLHLPPARLYEDNIVRRGHLCCSDFAVNMVDAGFETLRDGGSVIAVMQSNVGAYGAVTVHPHSPEPRHAH